MSRKMQSRARRWLVVGPALVALAALVFIWGAAAAGDAAAQEVSPGLEFSMVVAGAEDCDTRGGDAQCFIEPGSTFTLDVYLDSLPDGVSQYEGFDSVLNYEGVTSEDNGNTDAWPDCGFPATFFDPGLVAMSCAIGIPPAGPSNYLGLLATNDFTCSDSGSITMAFGMGNTVLWETVALGHTEDAPETLTITCGEPPPPTEEPEEGEEAEPTAVQPTALPSTGFPAAVDADGGVSGALWLAIGVLLAAAAGLGLFGWKYARSR